VDNDVGVKGQFSETKVMRRKAKGDSEGCKLLRAYWLYDVPQSFRSLLLSPRQRACKKKSHTPTIVKGATVYQAKQVA
jgi:hypothetical protein